MASVSGYTILMVTVVSNHCGMLVKLAEIFLCLLSEHIFSQSYFWQ